MRWAFYTSGTTADPKGAQHTDRTIMASAYGMSKALALTPGSARSESMFPGTMDFFVLTAPSSGSALGLKFAPASGSFTSSLGQIAGPAIAGILVATAGAGWTLAADAAITEGTERHDSGD